MAAKIKETRKLDRDDVRELCIHKNWYTHGDCGSYDKMLDMCNADNITTDLLYKIAFDIKEHSNTEYEISNIMFELARICISFFNIEE